MRFNRLDIIRYGALTDCGLDFRPDAKLHVIYGPNEAGKSSALSAISDLLFGFPRTTSHFSFLHDATTLRIGAEISLRDGTSLKFRRRRGTKNTLLAADEKETALPEDALSPYLGNLSRDVFERAFGLDSARLRQGAAAMLQSGGEIGSLLFSAASGLTGLSRLRQSLETEADGIYAQRRSKDRAFYQAYDRYEDARKLERDNELRSGDWKKLVADAAETEARLAALHRERQETKAALDRLNMLKKLEPVLREIDLEEELLRGFSDLQSIHKGFGDRLAEALDFRKEGEAALRTARQDVLRLQQEIQAVRVDTATLDAAGAIMERYAQKGAYLKAKDDMSRVRGEVEDFDLRLVQIARKLGMPDAEAMERNQPTEADLARLRALAVEGRDLKRAHAENRRRLEEEREHFRRLEAVEISGRLIDPKSYAQQLAALQPDIAELSRLDSLQVKLSRAQSELAEATGRLSPAVADLDQLFGVPLPDIATLTEHRRKFGELQTAAREAAAALALLETEQGALTKDIASLEQGGSLVTRQEIETARLLRDEQLRAFEASPSGGSKALEAAIREADRLADEALTDAERVSTHARLMLRRGELEPALQQARTRQTGSEQSIADAKSEFHSLFAATRIVPLEPDQMVEWRRAVETLAAQRNSVNVLADEVAILRASEDRLVPVLIDLAHATGLSGAGSLPVAALARGLSRHIADIGQRWADSRSAEGERQSVADVIERLEERETAVRKDAERWEATLAEAVDSVGLPIGATVEMVEATVDVWKDLPQILTERENRRRRVRGMQRDIAAFEDGLRALASDLAPDLASFSADAAADVLHDRAIAANSDQQRRKSLHLSLEQAEARLARCKSNLDVQETALAALADEASVSSDDLPQLLAQLRERSRLEESVSVCRRRFQEQADGQDEAHIRVALSDFDRIEANLEIERLEALDSDQLLRFGALTAQLNENQRQRSALETGASAEYAVFEKHAAEEEARDLARQWVVLKLAAHMLGTSMEAYRERQADPVMKRAGDIFSVLTGSRFSRLVQDYGSDDELQLLAERATGERVPLSGLSEGTGDQLYLALRLAFLEDYSARNEPAPLIVDDIFQTFDDDRTAAGLNALAGTVGRFQTILFTHEMSVVDIARREIGKDLDLIQL
ncbi:chromosome segregation protein SMC [Neorhizobium sp. P12A]|uniref:YhaN family protein n=1 Tax=Neorhizobium sp. P12A TaxID=2268027 RepID=UPI0011EC5CEE|nr:YhaN family protein [Neorhizobium sp. P12A]KAA0698361.1 chromosome segregation protein SMC [Neorhizobium sp. P12A]